MTRLIAGSAGGRRLRTPRDSATRPTSERVREALFGILDNRLTFAGALVLDLYAGSGSLGLEAASRGASWVTLVESRRSTAALAAANARATGLAGVVHLAAAPVERYLATGPPPVPVDLVLADPPYDLGETALTQALTLLTGHGWTARGAVVVVERSRRSPEPGWPEPLERTDMRRYGDTVLWFAAGPA